MEIRSCAIACLLGAVCIAPARALQSFSDADFLSSLSGIRGAAALPLAGAPRSVPRKVSAPAADKDAISARLDELLGFFLRLELQPPLDLSAMSREVVRGLDSGAYNGLILGESHSVQPEIDAGISIVKDVLAARGIGAFSRESGIFPDTLFLESQGIPVLTFRNQFRPDPDVLAALKAAGGKPLVTYTGHAHTAARLKDYILYTLLEGKPLGYAAGGRDMPTVEDSFLAARKKPVIVAMVSEARVLRRVEQLFLRGFIGETGVSGGEYLGNLRALNALWADKVFKLPAGAHDIFFVRSPEQANLFFGITPGERRPLAVDAVIETLSLPEFSAWLGEDRLRTVESLRGSDETGVFHRVVAAKSGGGTFERTVRRR